MKQKAKIYKGKRIVIGDKNLVTKNEIHVNDIPQEGVGNTPSTTKWTGHADVNGLKAIGWTDEDIAYYQDNGVNWNEEDDKYHKVTDDNKALYGVLTADNIQTYKDRIVYLPKIDTREVTSMKEMFKNCTSMVAIPQLDTQNVTNMNNMFVYCYSLVSVPLLDTQNVENMSSMFYYCYSITTIPQFDMQSVLETRYMFSECYSLKYIPILNMENVLNTTNMFNRCVSLIMVPELNTNKVTDMSSMFYYCSSLATIISLDTENASNIRLMFDICPSLTSVNLKNVKLSYDLSRATKLSKESLLYLINNEAATSVITITLHSYAYTRLAEDADVVAALTNHPNISLAK